MNFVSKNSTIQVLPAVSIEILTGIFATARGPPQSHQIPDNKVKWESTLMGLMARKEGLENETS
jgi:hypothetical protein